VRVDSHGSVAALNCGLASARGAIVAFIDDDAVPSADWLERIVLAFERDERIAAVGGRDLVHVDGRVVGVAQGRIAGRIARRLEVGRIQWFGRMVANHHLGAGGPRDVDVLKGANMSFRRIAVLGHGFDERLRGGGAVVHSELSICLPLRRQGLRIVYDPGIVVRHYPAPRPHGDRRDALRREATSSAAHNEALQIFDYFGPGRRLVFLVWGLAIGTTEAPGIAVLARDCLRRRPASWARFIGAQRGKAAALRTRRTPRPIPAPLACRESDETGHNRRTEALDAFSG
jgi:glycosyltransferase involved in cell wall biosynthesis